MFFVSGKRHINSLMLIKKIIISVRSIAKDDVGIIY